MVSGKDTITNSIRKIVSRQRILHQITLKFAVAKITVMSSSGSYFPVTSLNVLVQSPTT